MRTLVIPANVTIQQVEGFPADIERSVKGALYIRPASTLEVTDAEWAFIKRFYPVLAAMVIPVPAEPRR